MEEDGFARGAASPPPSLPRSPSKWLSPLLPEEQERKRKAKAAGAPHEGRRSPSVPEGPRMEARAAPPGPEAVSAVPRWRSPNAAASPGTAWPVGGWPGRLAGGARRLLGFPRGPRPGRRRPAGALPHAAHPGTSARAAPGPGAPPSAPGLGPPAPKGGRVARSPEPRGPQRLPGLSWPRVPGASGSPAT